MTSEAPGIENPSDNIPFVPTKPNQFWKKNAERLLGESISSYNDVAKQLIFVDSLLPGIYFNAIALSKVVQTSREAALIYLLPLAFWFTSLLLAFRSLYSGSKTRININSSRDSKEVFEKIVNEKHKYIQASAFFLIFSFLASSIVFWDYLTHFC